MNLKILYLNLLKLLFTVVCIAIPWLRASATHIVGGELGMEYRGGTTYRVSLTIYFDQFNGNTGAIDSEVEVHLFRKFDDALITSLDLRLREQTQFINSTFPSCGINTLQTRVLKYYDDFQFDPFRFNSPLGYYLNYERCCRNAAITNIQRPGQVGQAFYLEFPPMAQNSRVFTNSSPVFVTPVNDYACLNRPFELDFSATDADGDSLYYEIVEPWRGNSTNLQGSIIPPATPAPYAPVNWAGGWSSTNQIIATRPLNIGFRSGLLTVSPARIQGLMVFAVMVREVRNGVQIGLVRREYQLLVRACDPVPTPRLNVAVPGWSRTNNNLFFTTNDAVNINVDVNALLNTANNANVCVRAEALNFVPTTSLISSGSGCQNINDPGQTGRLIVTMPPCAARNSNIPYRIRLIATVDVCPQPSRDTVILNLYIAPKAVGAPKATITADKPIVRDTVTLEIQEVLNLQSIATDTNNSYLETKLQFLDSLSDATPTDLFTLIGRDSVNATHTWVSDCTPSRSTLPLFRSIGRNLICGRELLDTQQVFLRVIDTRFTAPEVFTSRIPVSASRDTIRVMAGEVVNFTASVTDTIRRFTSIRVVGINFANASNNRLIAADSNVNTGLSSVPVSYRTSCEDLRTNPIFIVLGKNSRCQKVGYDTAWVHLEVSLPPDSAPQVKTTLNPVRVKYDTVRLRVGQVINYRGIGVSPNNLATKLIVEGFGFSMPEMNGLQSSAMGFGEANAEITYTASCEDATLPVPPYHRIQVQNDPCRIDYYDTVFVSYVLDNTNAPVSATFVQAEPESRTIATPIRLNTELFVKKRLQGILQLRDPDSTQLSAQFKARDFKLEELGLPTQSFIGKGALDIPIKVEPTCGLLGSADKRTFQFSVLLRDSLCNPAIHDSAVFVLEVIDSATRGFFPPNVITPNGDGVNDVLDLQTMLPPDNCKDEFEWIRIFNRYGVLEYESRERAINWSAKDYPNGTHFWMVKFRNKAYRGWLEVIY